jgi:ATP-dependent Lon protease
VAFREGQPSADDLDALLPAVIADLTRERALDQSWVPPLDGAERTIVARYWRGGSVRRLCRIVDALLRERDVRATRTEHDSRGEQTRKLMPLRQNL